MQSHPQTSHVLAVDLYGTVLDTTSISQAVDKHTNIGADKASQLSTLWRRYQLEYTWRLNSMGVYEPFDEVTRKSLLHAAAESNTSVPDNTVQALMDAYYNELQSFPDVDSALERLESIPNVRIVIFSNGTVEMVTAALQSTNLISPARGVFSIDTVQRYKPATEVYQALLRSVDKEGSASDCWLVSGNPFDVCGARSCGMNAIWVDRARKGWIDRLGDFQPNKIVNSLEEIIAIVQAFKL